MSTPITIKINTMNLGFRTKWPNGEPTYFVNKIWCSFNKAEIITKNENFGNDFQKIINSEIGQTFYKDSVKCFRPKLHTIREDKPDRWKAGNKIHFVINNRSKDRFQFAPVIPVISVQKIEMQPSKGRDYVWIYVDGRMLSFEESEKLAINDGFESLKQFCVYFNKGFTGKIIHWTNIKY